MNSPVLKAGRHIQNPLCLCVKVQPYSVQGSIYSDWYMCTRVPNLTSLHTFLSYTT